MRVSLIVARADNGVIGVDNKLPWHLPCDLKYFKRVTMGKPVVMGRKTFESIGRPLPGRTNVVVTRNHDWSALGVRAVSNLRDGLKLACTQAELDGVDEVMLIGGASIYQESMALVDRMYVTQVHVSPEGDAFFKAPDEAIFEQISVDDHFADEISLAYSYEIWDRREITI
ncbi:MAG: dihydrofolate reductase [Gammaproteobacteria bacterium]|nr:dihydrofolate reductase [Gammaproteobacteria bacterium]HAN80357.1 dihydrofolate reductase [Gammaproteobacteria bacterium]